MILFDTDYGALGPVVSAGGSLIAAVAALGLAWRGRTRWEPSEEDISRGPQKVGGVAAAVSIAVLWADTASSPGDRYLPELALALAAASVVSLLIYGFITATQTYEVVLGSRKKGNIIGGFWLTGTSRAAKKERGVTTQDVLRGAAYDVDRVWPRGARALAKATFVLCYLALTVSGTVALAAAAMLLD